MAMKQYTADEVLEADFDDSFGVSDGYSSDEDGEEDLYAYLGQPVVLRSVLEALTCELITKTIVAVLAIDGNDRQNLQLFMN